MKSAPKDGTLILAYGVAHAGGFFADVKWLGGEHGSWFLFHPGDDDWTSETSALTHWMPLPDPPAALALTAGETG